MAQDKITTKTQNDRQARGIPIEQQQIGTHSRYTKTQSKQSMKQQENSIYLEIKDKTTQSKDQ